MTLGSLRKRQRLGSASRLFAFSKPDSTRPDETLTETSQKPSGPQGFNDLATADVVLRLYLEPSPLQLDPDAGADPKAISSAGSANEVDVKLHLHSNVLRRSKYFSALLSDRWQRDSGKDSDRVFHLNLKVPATFGSINDHLKVLQLLYADDLVGSIGNVSLALSILPVALELLFEDCVVACVRFLEAVPWSEDEEKRVLSIIPLLREEESRELLARVSPEKSDCSEEMLYGLIVSAISNHQPMAAIPKAFLAKLLRDFSSRDWVRSVLDRLFETSLNVIKEAMEEYSSPDFRGDHNETEAIQRLNLHKAMTNGRYVAWLLDRMIELKVADNAVKEWSDQASLTADLQRAFRDDAWMNIVPGFPALMLRCTYKLSNTVATGSILASREVRTKFVKDWLPVLIVCREAPIGTAHKALYLDLEETFLRIISTLPLSDAKDLLRQCLSFSTRNVEDCPHLVSAFNTWFRRATQPPQGLLSRE